MPQFDNRNLQASHGLYKHDLSYRNAFTSHFGMLLPFMVCDVVGNSRVELSTEHQTRALPLNNAAFVRLREHYDYFFVPYSQLYRQYDNFKTQQSNQNSMLDKNAFPNIVTKLPTFSAFSLESCLEVNDTQMDVAGFPMAYGAARLFDLLGYGNYTAYNPSTESKPSLNLVPGLEYNPFRLLAYQKIYFDYYRNDKYEENRTNYYNIDDLASGSSVNTIRLKQLSLIHYRWRRKDYFTQLTPDLLPTTNQFNRSGFTALLRASNYSSGLQYNKPSSQFTIPTGGVATTGVSTNIPTPSPVPDTSPAGIFVQDGATVTTGNAVVSSGGLNYSNQSDIQHRLIEARQKMLERMYAANSDFSSQMLAIYGYAPIEGRHGKVKHIGGFSELLNVTDVNNTSTAYKSQGDGTFGKINSYGSSKSLKFHVPEDGIIMGIYSTDCMPDYSSRKIDRFNFKSVPEDYFNPYFEGLGKQALFSPEYSFICNDDTGQTPQLVANPCTVLGFIPRYAEYKAKVDEVHGQLDYGGIYSNYTSAFNVDCRLSKPMMSIENLVNNPFQLDGVFFVNFNGKDTTDCFLCNMYNEVKVLAPVKRNSEL